LFRGQVLNLDEVDLSLELRQLVFQPQETSRWCLLKRPDHLTDNQVDKLQDLLACNLKAVRLTCSRMISSGSMNIKCWLGRQISPQLVHKDHAIPAHADEEGGQDVALPQGTLAQLVPGQRQDCLRLRGGIQ